LAANDITRYLLGLYHLVEGKPIMKEKKLLEKARKLLDTVTALSGKFHSATTKSYGETKAEIISYKKTTLKLLEEIRSLTSSLDYIFRLSHERKNCSVYPYKKAEAKLEKIDESLDSCQKRLSNLQTIYDQLGKKDNSNDTLTSPKW